MNNDRNNNNASTFPSSSSSSSSTSSTPRSFHSANRRPPQPPPPPPPPANQPHNPQTHPHQRLQHQNASFARTPSTTSTPGPSLPSTPNQFLHSRPRPPSSPSSHGAHAASPQPHSTLQAVPTRPASRSALVSEPTLSLTPDFGAPGLSDPNVLNAGVTSGISNFSNGGHVHRGQHGHGHVDDHSHTHGGGAGHVHGVEHGHDHHHHEHDHGHSHGHFQNQSFLHGAHQHNHNHGHPPDGHGDSHDHGHSPYQNHDHDHSHDHNHDHGHSHDHNHDHGDSHDHGHDHGHHHHHHDHVSGSDLPLSHLPSIRHVLRDLSNSETSQLRWAVAHLFTGFATYAYGQSVESLAFIGIAYLEVYDALGVFNALISSVVAARAAFRDPSAGYPYGARRYEVLFAFSASIYLLFSALHMCKEGLEHALMAHHEPFQGSIFMVLVALAGLAVTVHSAVTFSNHQRLCILLKPNIATGLESAYRNQDVMTILTSNIFASMSVGSIAGVGISCLLMTIIPIPGFDSLIGLALSAIMFFSAIPTASALAEILLQASPRNETFDSSKLVSELTTSIPHVVACRNEHFWTNTFRDVVGTLELEVDASADRSAVLDHARRVADAHYLSGLTVQLVSR